MKTNWSEIVSALKASGMTYAEIGESANCAGSTIGDLATGRSKSPRADSAIRLLALHDKKVGKPTQNAEAA